MKYDSVTGNAPIIDVQQEKKSSLPDSVLHNTEEAKVEIVSFERGKIDFEDKRYRKLIAIGEGYLVEEINSLNPKASILRCEFDNKMRKGSLNKCQELPYKLEVAPYKEGHYLGTVKVSYQFGRLYIIFDTFSGGEKEKRTRNIEFIVKNIKSDEKLSHFMSICSEDSASNLLQFDFFLSQQLSGDGLTHDKVYAYIFAINRNHDSL